MARNGEVLNFSGPFPDGDGICDLAARVFKDTSVMRAAHATLGPQVPKQLFFQRSARLKEQATVNGFVGHAQALVIGILDFQPSGNLLRRPVQNQFTRNQLLQLPMDGKKAPLVPQGRLPGFRIRLVGSIHRTAIMTRDFPAHGRHRSVQVFGNLPYRRSRNDPSRDRLALTQREREERAAPDRNKPTARPISHNDCPAFQRRHTSLFCAAESPNRFPWIINTTFESRFIPDGVASTG
jgi:hypothetical protein